MVDPSRILNLGCGNRLVAPKPGESVVNHDRVKHRPEVDMAWDLNDLPWPWPDGSFDLVVARSVLEHLKIDLVESLDECWRILAPRGTLYVKLPYWKADSVHSDPTHRWFYTLESLDLFDPETERGKLYGFYTERKWRCVRAPRMTRAQTSIYATLEVQKA